MNVVREFGGEYAYRQSIMFNVHSEVLCLVYM